MVEANSPSTSTSANTSPDLTHEATPPNTAANPALLANQAQPSLESSPAPQSIAVAKALPVAPATTANTLIVTNTPICDLYMFPHIVNEIVSHITEPTELLRLRSVNHAVRDRADRNLARHLVFREDKVCPAGLPGWHPRLHILDVANGNPETHRDYEATARLVSRSVEILNVVGYPHAELADRLELLLEDAMIKFLRGQRLDYRDQDDFWYEDDNGGLIPPLLELDAWCIVYQDDPAADSLDYAAVNIRPTMFCQSVHHVTPIQFFHAEFDEFRDLEKYDSDIHVEIVFIFHGEGYGAGYGSEPDESYSLQPRMLHPGGALAAMEVMSEDNRHYVTFVNFEECVPREAYDLPGDLFESDDWEEYYHPFEFHLEYEMLKTKTKHVLKDRIYFIDLETYKECWDMRQGTKEVMEWC